MKINETSVSELTLMNRVEKSLLHSPPEIKAGNPAWQAKWLALRITSPAVQALADATEAWCGRFARNKRDQSLLVVAGPPGTGKTHVARRARDVCARVNIWGWEHGHYEDVPVVLFCSWPNVLDSFKAGKFEIMEELFDAGALFLDDIGAEADKSKMGSEKLTQVLSRRERMHTFLTTNIVPNQWAKIFESRVADRLLRNSVFVDLSGVESFAFDYLKTPEENGG